MEPLPIRVEEPHKPSWKLVRIRRHSHLLYDIGSIYGVQFAHYILPLITVPYLSRVLGPASLGLLAMAQAFGMYGNLIVEYGFVYSGTRQIATASSSEEIGRIVAGVSGAKALLAAAVAAGAYAAYIFVPLFHQNALLLWSAVIAEIIKAGLPTYYFYGVKRVAVASLLDISARTAAAAGIFVLVRKPDDAWRVFALQAAGAILAFIAGHVFIYSRYTMRLPRVGEGLRMLREGGAMFLFRSAHSIYVLGNAFILGLFASPQAVGFYAGAEKINSGAVGLLSPLSTALYPRAAALVKSSMPKAARLTTISLCAMGAVSLSLALVMWFGSEWIVRLVLGPRFQESSGVLKILSLRAPLVAVTNVLGFQWLLALGLETSFQKITIIALVLNVLLAMCFAPKYTYSGMAWAVVISQSAAVIGIWSVLRRRKLNPLVIAVGTSYV